MKSVREIYKIGRGPSSSHTIGPERAAALFKSRYPEADSFRVCLYGSLSKTGKGHGTDRVLREVLSPLPADICFCRDEETPAGVTHPNTMDFFAFSGERTLGTLRVLSVGGGDIRIDGEPRSANADIYLENTFAEVQGFCRFRDIDLAEYVELNEGGEIREFLGKIWDTMKNAIEEGLRMDGVLPGGLGVQRKAKLLYNNTTRDNDRGIRESRLVSAFAYAVAEQNADCHTIVTAPTCGACGVIPASLRYYQLEKGLSDEDMVKGLAVAGLFGTIIKQNASISGAECGCQAEVGSACSMASAALAYLEGLSPEQVGYAAEIAMEHHLGLTCDPISGLVQVPCIERNAAAAMRAIDASRLACFLTGTQRISFDIIVKTMYETGISMNSRFRETSEGGLAKMFERRR